ncbi:MAG: sigma 54-interacting transcriptional regulator [Acidobacteriota bacterium]
MAAPPDSGIRESPPRVESPPPSASRFCLRGEINGIEQIFSLRDGENRLGALESNEVALPLAGVSRVHARLTLEGEHLLLEDLASKNGTYVGGRRIERMRVGVGSDLRFGSVALRFQEFHRDDGELAIAFDPPASRQTDSFPVEEALDQTGTQVASLSGTWLLLADRFQEALLAAGRDVDPSAAFSLLLEELQLEGLCLVERSPGGDPVVLHAAGRVDASATDTLRDRLAGEGASATREVAIEQVDDDAQGALTLIMHHRAGREPRALALWGKFPGRSQSEIFFRLLMRMLEAASPPGVSGGDAPPSEFPGLVVPADYVYGRSPQMRQIYELMQTLAQGDLPVLIVGETGVGKEYLAQILHSSSPRRRGPFVAINCAAIPAELLEAELFGIGDRVATGVTARKGRFQLADGGTLFLDEIGDMSADLQAKLLRALQEKEVHPLGQQPTRVDVRVLAATNQELGQKIQSGSFRADLYYRLAGYVLEIPPLRERRDDVPPLVEHFLRRCASDLNRSIRGLTVHALRMLTEYPWPGNVRELANEVRRAVYLCPEHRTIESSGLSKTIRQHFDGRDGAVEVADAAPIEVPPTFEVEPVSVADPAAEAATDPAEATRIVRRDDASSTSLSGNLAFGLDSLDLERLEAQAIGEALRRCGGNQVQAAKLLGITRQKLRRRMERFDLFDGPEGESS